MSKVRCFACAQFGHLDCQCLEKKKKKRDEEVTLAATIEVEDFARRFEKEFFLFSLVSSVDSNGVVQNSTWFIDSGASRHMTGLYHIFREITEVGPNWMVQSEGGMMLAMRGFGRVRFQVDQVEILEHNGFLFVPGLSVNLIFV